MFIHNQQKTNTTILYCRFVELEGLILLKTLGERFFSFRLGIYLLEPRAEADDRLY